MIKKSNIITIITILADYMWFLDKSDIFIFSISKKLMEIVKITEIPVTLKFKKYWKFDTDHSLYVLISSQKNRF